jgi:hypothetical protein
MYYILIEIHIQYQEYKITLPGCLVPSDTWLPGSNAANGGHKPACNAECEKSLGGY